MELRQRERESSERERQREREAERERQREESNKIAQLGDKWLHGGKYFMSNAAESKVAGAEWSPER